jgi:hypothetical protein
VFGEEATTETIASLAAPKSVVMTADSELLQAAGEAANGDKFRRLWAGDTAGYPSSSEADQALANLLAFWVGSPDPARIESLMRQSGLMRPKWDQHKMYLANTIKKALEGRTEFYGSDVRSGSKVAGDHAPEVVTPPTDEDQRQRFVERVQRRIRHRGFRGIIQYGRVDACYEMLFVDRKDNEVRVPFKSTSELHQRKSVACRLWETIDFELTTKQEDWWKVIRLLRKLMIVRPGQDESQTIQDRIEDYISSKRKVKLTSLDAALVVAGVDVDGKAIGHVESFRTRDGCLYVKLPDLQRWLAQEWTAVKSKDLKTALTQMGFAPERIDGWIEPPKGSNKKRERRQARYWVRAGGSNETV